MGLVYNWFDLVSTQVVPTVIFAGFKTPLTIQQSTINIH